MAIIPEQNEPKRQGFCPDCLKPLDCCKCASEDKEE